MFSLGRLECNCFSPDLKPTSLYVTHFQHSLDYTFWNCRWRAIIRKDFGTCFSEIYLQVVTVSWQDIYYKWISGIICPIHSICWEVSYCHTHLQILLNLLIGCICWCTFSLYTSQIHFLSKLYSNIMLPKHLKVLKGSQHVNIVRRHAKCSPPK